ncbi:MAG: YndJ family transporter [Saprospiraceae bacterium]|nr:YndJ family transporter [Saprospiraceae bacterium]
MNYPKMALLGAGIWLLLLYWVQPNARQDEWARLLLALAVLVWTPLAFQLLHYAQRFAVWTGMAGILLAVSLFFPSGLAMGTLACGWLLVALWAFQQGVARLREWRNLPGNMAIGAGQVFLLVGSLWAVFDRFGWRPLGFDPAIVLLTAVHFHYAGFLFPLLAGWLQELSPGVANRLAALLAILAIPMTAVGITVMQVSGVYWPEAIAAAVVALSGWLCGFGYLRLAMRGGTPFGARFAAIALALCLFFTMTLALGYAMRGYYPLEFLNIPSMRAWHGSVNALGVAGFGLYFRWLWSCEGPG